MLSIILGDRGKMPNPASKHALDVVKSEVIPYVSNHVLNFITRGKFSISQDLLDHPKNQKSHGMIYISGEWGGCGILEKWFSLVFDVTFDPLWHIELSMCTQKLILSSGAENSGLLF
jgi:hypothetical protein